MAIIASAIFGRSAFTFGRIRIIRFISSEERCPLNMIYKHALDLFGDRSQFQVVLKLPYASLGDRRVKQRMEDDPGWYGLFTAQQLVQSLGRSVRSMNDRATSYILDATWPRFLQENRRFLPAYFLNALREFPAAVVR